jgi:hypothetical protein
MPSNLRATGLEREPDKSGTFALTKRWKRIDLQMLYKFINIKSLHSGLRQD